MLLSHETLDKSFLLCCNFDNCFQNISQLYFVKFNNLRPSAATFLNNTYTRLGTVCGQLSNIKSYLNARLGTKFMF